MDTPSFPLTARIERSTEQISSNLPDATVLLSLETSKYYGFEEVGKRVWDLLEAPTSLADICSALQQVYDVGEKQCYEDVGRFISQLAESGLIRVDHDSGA